MFVSRNTVKKYLISAFSKLGMTSRIDLVRESARREATNLAPRPSQSRRSSWLA